MSLKKIDPSLWSTELYSYSIIIKSMIGLEMRVETLCFDILVISLFYN